MSVAAAETCAALADRLGEPLLATAPEAAGWLVLEHHGPWGRDALTESGFEAETVAALSTHAATRRLRVLLARRPARAERSSRRVALALTPGSGAVREIPFADERELRELILGEAMIGTPLVGPTYLVCTHGKRDRCCARLGVAVARRLARHAPRRVWECSHLGGHRFAANLLVLPDSLLLGRVDEDNVESLVAGLEQGRLPLEHVRGRCTDPEDVQAVEALARRALGVVEADAVSVRAAREIAGAAGERHIEAELAVAGRVVRVVVHGRPGEPRPVSCGGGKLEAPTAWTLESLSHAAG